MKRECLWSMVVAAVLMFADRGEAASILVNGSFEALGGSGNSNTGQGIVGWTIGNTGGIDIVHSTGFIPFFWVAADGDVSLSLNWAGPGSVSQAVSTIPGATYQLNFYMGAELYGGIANRTMEVVWNGNVIASPSFQFANQPPNGMGWMLMQYNVAGTGNDTLLFRSTTPDNYGPALDGVSLVLVPEPGTGAFLLTSVLAGSVLRRRMRSA